MINTGEYASQHCVIVQDQLCQETEKIFNENNLEQRFSKSFLDQQQPLAQGSANIFCKGPESKHFKLCGLRGKTEDIMWALI